MLGISARLAEATAHNVIEIPIVARLAISQADLLSMIRLLQWSILQNLSAQLSLARAGGAQSWARPPTVPGDTSRSFSDVGSMMRNGPALAGGLVVL